MVAEVLPKASCPSTGEQILACLQRIELILARRMPRPAPKRTIGTGSDAIPFVEIVKAWHEINPTLPQVVQLTNQRRAQLRKLWNQFRHAEGGPMDGIRGLFEMVKDSDYLSGRSTAWQCDMWWVIDPDHMLAIVEGRYSNRAMPKQTNGKRF